MGVRSALARDRHDVSDDQEDAPAGDGLTPEDLRALAIERLVGLAHSLIQRLVASP